MVDFSETKTRGVDNNPTKLTSLKVPPHSVEAEQAATASPPHRHADCSSERLFRGGESGVACCQWIMVARRPCILPSLGPIRPPRRINFNPPRDERRQQASNVSSGATPQDGDMAGTCEAGKLIRAAAHGVSHCCGGGVRKQGGRLLTERVCDWVAIAT